MRLLLLMIFSQSLYAQCFTDLYGNVTCIQTESNIYDMRNITNSPIIIENGKYRGNLNNNPFDPNSINNQFGRYGNPLSKDSLFNPFRNR